MHKVRGFTLIEVLVALTIVAIALVAGTQATSALIYGAQRQTDILLAQMCAENALTAIRLSKQFPGVGDSSSTCEQVGRSFTVRMEVRPTLNPNFRRVDTRVLNANAEQGAVLSIATIVGR